MKQLLVGCLIGALVLSVVVVVGFWFLFIRELPLLDAELTLPPGAVMGSSIEMVVTAHNPHDEAVKLDCIDISNEILEGFQVVSVSPPANDSYEVPFFGMRTWEFGASVEPRESIAVTFELRPVAPGRFRGEIDVCNPNQDSKTLFADVVVKEEAAEELEDAAGAQMMLEEPTPALSESMVESMGEFDVILSDTGSQKIQVIKAIREATGLGLKDAKDLVDNAPSTIKADATIIEATEIVEKLKNAGAKVTLAKRAMPPQSADQ